MNITSYQTRSALAAAAPSASESAWVEEVRGHYFFVPGDLSAADGWRVIASGGPVAGNWIFNSSEMTLPVLGGGQDDWPNFAAAAASVAAKHSLRLADGATYLCKSVQVLPNNSVIIGGPSTTILQSLPTGTGNPRVAAFSAGYVSGTSTFLAESAKEGSSTVKTTDLVAPGGFVMIIESGVGNFRLAMYKVVGSAGEGPYTLTLDRPVRRAFNSGDEVVSVTPVENIRIYGNGMVMKGTGSRYCELIGAWNCVVSGLNFDTSAGKVDERFLSIDVPSFNCQVEKCVGDGGGLVELGLSMESSEGCVFRDCVVTRCQNGYIFQDCVDCAAYECRSYGNGGAGIQVTAATGNVLGCSSCSIVGGSWSGNYHGILIDYGSSNTRVTAASVIGNANTAIAFGTAGEIRDTMIGQCDIRLNGGPGIELRAAAIDTKIVGCTITDNQTGIYVPAGCFGTVIESANVSRCVQPLAVLSDCEVIGLQGTVPESASSGILVAPGGSLRARGVILNTVSTGGVNTILVMDGATLELEASVLTLSSNAKGIVTNGETAVATITGGKIVPAAGATGTVALFAAAGTIRLGASADIQSCAVPTIGSGYFSIGTVNVDGSLPVEVAWPNLRSTDMISFTRSVDGGIPGNPPQATKTVGSKFTVVADPFDTSVYEYRIF